MALRHLTVKERIQLHLFDYGRFSEDYEAPVEVTQESIASAVGIRVPHVLQYLRPLIEEGLAEGRTSHVRRRPRRRKVYFLTPAGRSRTASLRKELLDGPVAFRTAGGPIKEVPLAKLFQEDRRGATLLELLEELETLGAIAEASGEAPKVRVDQTQEAPAVGRFFGREAELDAVLRAVQSHRMVVVTGMAGIGKTTLASKVCEALRGKRHLYWRTMRPWDSSLELAYRLAIFLRALGRTELHATVAGPGPKNLSQIEDRLARDLAGTDALIVLDDVHSTSPDAQTFCAILLRALGQAPGASALLLSRVVPTFYSRRDVSVEGSIVEIALRGLDRESSLALLRNAGLRDPLLGSLADACEGVPLFLVLLASAKDRGHPLEIRRTVEAYISEEIDRTLDDSERGCLEAASFCNVPVPIDVLLVEPGVRTKTVIGLERKGLLTTVGSDRRVVHETLRDYFRQGLSDERRDALIGSVVPKLLDAARDAETRGRLSDAIAYVGNAVFVESDRERRTLCLRKLADLRRSIGDLPAAIESYRTALGEIDQPVDRARLLERIAACLQALGHFDDAESAIEEGLRPLPSQPSLEAAWLSYRRADVAMSREDYDRASGEVERLIGWMAGLPKDYELWASLANLRGFIHMDDPRRQDYALANRDFQEALRAWEAVGNPQGISLACNNLGLASIHLGRPDEGLAYLDRGASLAEAIGDLPVRLKALFVKAWYLSECRGQYDAAEKLYGETYRLAKETHQREKMIAHYVHLADLYRRQGGHAEARESLEYYLSQAGFMINEETRIRYLSLMVRLCILCDDIEAAELHAQEAERIHRGTPSAITSYFAEWTRGSLRGARGRRSEAAAAFRRAFDQASATHDGEFLLEYGRFMAAGGQTAEARDLLGQARDAFRMESVEPMAREAEQALRSLGGPDGR